MPELTDFTPASLFTLWVTLHLNLGYSAVHVTGGSITWD